MSNKGTAKKAVARITEWKVLEPFLADYRTKFHGRQLAHLLKMNHGTVALALKRLEKGNILKVDLEGRNKKYYLNLDNFSTKGYISDVESSRAMTHIGKHFLLKKMLTEFSPNLFREIPIVLFGSYARGSYTNKSDIDILILDDGDRGKSIAKFLRTFGERHNKSVQVQRMSQKNFERGLRDRDTLILEIVKNHVILNNVPTIVDILWRYYHEIR